MNAAPGRLAVLACLLLIGLTADAQTMTGVRIETAPVEFQQPDRYQTPIVLEPNRHIRLMAPEDSTVKLIEPALGSRVKQQAIIVRLDSAEADAQLQVIEARVKAREIASRTTQDPVAAAELAVVKAEASLARLRAERQTLRAPFEGILLATFADSGQYVTRGQPIAELGDVSRLRALVPADRTAIQPGGTIRLAIEGKPSTAVVRAVVPLPDTFATLRELATPYAGAWIEIDNARGDFQPGMRVKPPGLPEGPIAPVAASAIHDIPGGSGATVQVIRADYVQDLPVVVLGEIGPDRVQVAGPFRGGDTVIVSSSIPLAARTYVRFGGEAGAGNGPETRSPDAGGSVVQVSTPAAPPTAAVAPGNPAVAPIGAPGSAAPGASQSRKAAAASAPTATPNRGGTPTPSKPAGKAVTPF